MHTGPGLSTYGLSDHRKEYEHPSYALSGVWHTIPYFLDVHVEFFLQFFGRLCPLLLDICPLLFRIADSHFC